MLYIILIHQYLSNITHTHQYTPMMCLGSLRSLLGLEKLSCLGQVTWEICLRQSCGALTCHGLLRIENAYCNGSLALKLFDTSQTKMFAVGFPVLTHIGSFCLGWTSIISRISSLKQGHCASFPKNTFPNLAKIIYIQHYFFSLCL